MKHPIELLSQIQKVEAPPFLMTRIRQKIDDTNANQLSPRWAWSLGLSFLMVVMLNIVAISRYSQASSSENNIVNTMNLSPDNSLYK